MTPQQYTNLAIAGSLLVGLLVALWAVWAILRRKIGPRQTEVAGAGFSLSDLRDLLGRGHISQGEFDALKASLVEQMSKETDEKDEASGRRAKQPGRL